MLRGTTPTIYLDFSPDWDQVDKLTVTFTQSYKRLKLEKDRFAFSDGKISTTLTQEETLSLNCRTMCEVQIKVKNLDGKVYASNIVQVDISRILDEVIM